MLSFAEWNDQKSYQAVEAVISNEKDYDLYTITLATGETITSTEGHPLFVPNRGWTDARLLKAGDHLYLQSKGTVRIKTITTEHKHETVYNLSVANTHTFFVGEEGVLVHNTCPRPPRPHLKHPARELPNDGDRRYVPPKRNGKPEIVKDGKGYLDKDGNNWEWTKDPHGGPHWDVQHPNRTHMNVGPNGNVIGTDNFPNVRR